LNWGQVIHENVIKCKIEAIIVVFNSHKLLKTAKKYNKINVTSSFNNTYSQKEVFPPSSNFQSTKLTNHLISYPPQISPPNKFYTSPQTQQGSSAHHTLKFKPYSKGYLFGGKDSTSI